MDLSSSSRIIIKHFVASLINALLCLSISLGGKPLLGRFAVVPYFLFILGYIPSLLFDISFQFSELNKDCVPLIESLREYHLFLNIKLLLLYFFGTFCTLVGKVYMSSGVQLSHDDLSLWCKIPTIEATIPRMQLANYRTLTLQTPVIGGNQV